jgi:8-oxo-dGTP diphosphatase
MNKCSKCGGDQYLQPCEKCGAQIRPKVGLGVIIVKDGKVLVGRRLGSHGEGLIAFPGGHLEWFEEYADCAEREVLEETGMKVRFRPLDPLQPEAFTTNNLMVEDHKHYITIFVVADWVEGEAKNVLPNKCEGWQWVSYQDLLKLVPPEAFCNPQHPQNHWIPTAHIAHWKDVIRLY